MKPGRFRFCSFIMLHSRLSTAMLLKTRGTVISLSPGSICHLRCQFRFQKLVTVFYIIKSDLY